MAETSSCIPLQASGVRRARYYEPIVRGASVCEEYPVGCSAFLTSIHDARYYQGILSNAQNFSPNTKCEIFQMKDGKAEWKHQLDDEKTLEYLKTDTSSEHNPAFQVIFCTIANANHTSFGCQLSLSSKVTRALLERFEISPQYLCLLLGEPDYWAPGDFAEHSSDGSLHRIEFFCQQPRWNIHKRDIPCEKQSRNEIVKERLQDMFTCKRATLEVPGNFVDPFMLHLTITHEAFLEAKAIITDMRYQLYDQLDHVDQYCAKRSEGRGKYELEDLTIRLHTVSQDTDSMSASADMANMILRRISEAHSRYAACVRKEDRKDSLVKTTDTINYLSTSVESQLRWLASYKSRKDIAMNLVFNLVTQQDASTSTTIAREAKADGTSMKIIAALTMVFLPGTFLSSVFGMSSLEDARWWLYLAITIPMTLLVIGTWWFWFTYPSIVEKKKHFVVMAKQRLSSRV